MTELAISPSVPRRARASAILGVLSVVLLGASFVWAHHWGVQTDTLIVAWATSTVGALVLSTRVLLETYVGAWFARIGLIGSLVSVAALAVVGVLYAAGINPTGICGGG